MTSRENPNLKPPPRQASPTSDSPFSEQLLASNNTASHSHQLIVATDDQPAGNTTSPPDKVQRGMMRVHNSAATSLLEEIPSAKETVLKDGWRSFGQSERLNQGSHRQDLACADEVERSEEWRGISDGDGIVSQSSQLEPQQPFQQPQRKASFAFLDTPSTSQLPLVQNQQPIQFPHDQRAGSETIAEHERSNNQNNYHPTLISSLHNQSCTDNSNTTNLTKSLSVSQHSQNLKLFSDHSGSGHDREQPLGWKSESTTPLHNLASASPSNTTTTGNNISSNISNNGSNKIPFAHNQASAADIALRPSLSSNSLSNPQRQQSSTRLEMGSHDSRHSAFPQQGRRMRTLQPNTDRRSEEEMYSNGSTRSKEVTPVSSSSLAAWPLFGASVVTTAGDGGADMKDRNVIAELSTLEGNQSAFNSGEARLPSLATPRERCYDETDLETIDGEHPNVRVQVQFPTVGTPSTVSTTPSTDDASFGTDCKLDDISSMLPNLLHPTSPHSGHRRAGSWGEEMRLTGPAWQLQPQHIQGHSVASMAPQSRVASFRDEVHGARNIGETTATAAVGLDAARRARLPPSHENPVSANTSATNTTWAHHAQTSRHQYLGQNPFSQSTSPPPRQQQQAQAHHHHHPQQQPQQNNFHRNVHAHADSHISTNQGSYGQIQRRTVYGGTSPSNRGRSLTPPRSARSQTRQHGANTPGRHGHGSGQVMPGSPHQGGSNPHRSSAEILKTLLRKKACLYEPDTSRAVALVTWLVGRELAIQHGYFSRQQLQSGVHSCVAQKIENGTITRTKVNRCMQIILNSCFHYIIPRSDGTEERGDVFRDTFAPQAVDDSLLLNNLPSPWHDLGVDREAILEASKAELEERTSRNSTPKSSPRLVGMNPDRSPTKDGIDSDYNESSKRAVLLCFNENVRCAEDVFRCHNEFIRDTANASHLQLSADEWKTFFGLQTSRGSYLWSNVGIPLATGDEGQQLGRGPSKQADILGRMSPGDMAKFRTTWCSKRYDHDHELCGFAHVEFNGGWLRRNPQQIAYSDEMCSFVSTSADKKSNQPFFFINECPRGVNCNKAHSMEEILYSPSRYKAKPCSATSHGRNRGCHLGDVCPHLHSMNSGIRPMKKAPDNRQHGSRHHKKSDHSNAKTVASQSAPTPSPIIYASPAPVSDFERHLGLPGLQNLYRRHCSVARAQVRSSGQAQLHYSCFGDDAGIRLEQAVQNRPIRPAKLIRPNPAHGAN